MSKNFISVEVADQLMARLSALGFKYVQMKLPNANPESNTWVSRGPDAHCRLIKNGYGIWFFKVEDGQRKYAVVGGGMQEWGKHNIADEASQQKLIDYVVDLAERSGILESQVKDMVAQMQDLLDRAGIESYQTQVGQHIDLNIGKPGGEDWEHYNILGISFHAHRQPDTQLCASYANDRYSDFYKQVEDSTSVLVKSFDDVFAGLTADAALSKPHRRQVEVGNSFVTLNQPSYYLFDMLARGLESIKCEMVKIYSRSDDAQVAALLDTPDDVHEIPKYTITFRS